MARKRVITVQIISHVRASSSRELSTSRSIPEWPVKRRESQPAAEVQEYLSRKTGFSTTGKQSLMARAAHHGEFVRPKKTRAE